MIIERWKFRLIMKYHPIRQKGIPFPYDFLLVEFRKQGLIFRVRYRVVQFPSSDYSIQIRKRKVVVGRLISEKMLFRAMTKHVSERFKILSDSIVFRWEDGNLEMPKK